MLSDNPFLLWLDRHPSCYFWLVGGLITLAFGLVVRPLLRTGPADPRRHDWAWSLMILAILAAGRWPSFLLHMELNVDEGHLLAGAVALLRDPVVWRAVDGTTAGPLNFFALWPAGAVLGFHDYLPARLTALGLLVITFTFVHQSLALLVGSRIARAASLPALALESLTNSGDLLHYSTEMLAIALLAIATYAAVRRWAGHGPAGWCFLGGLMLGAAPLGKLQVAPLAAPLGLAWLVAEFFAAAPRSRRHQVYLVLGAVLPVVLVAVQLVIAGNWRDAMVSYLSQSVHYVDARPIPLTFMLRSVLANSMADDSLYHLWLPAVLGGILVMLPWRRPGASQLARLAAGAAVACLLALACVLAAGRPFLHYWQLLIAPLTFLAGVCLARLLAGDTQPFSRFRWLAVACVLAALLPMLAQRARTPNPLMGKLAYLDVHRQTILSERVAHHAQPGDLLAVWGWTVSLYVETGLPPATRDTHIERALTPGPFRDYFQARFLRDLAGARPALFVDSVGPSSLVYLDPKYRHERVFPVLGDYVASHYDLVEEVNSARIYRRKEPRP